MYDATKPYKRQLRQLIQSTWLTPYIEVKDGLYATFQKKFSYPEVDHTDGLGTKGYYHWQRRTWAAAVQDALAMNLNDLLLVGAVPYKLQNHLTLPDDDHQTILEIIGCLAQECGQRQIAMTGGETSIHNNSDSLELSLTVSGFIKKSFENKCRPGDIVIGLPSSGLHSNGFSKVREVFKNELREEFTTPTVIYSDQLLSVLDKFELHGLMHMTGGAFTKLLDILSAAADIRLTRDHKLEPQLIFFELYQRGLTDQEMYQIFNCGVGFIVTVDKDAASLILKELPKAAIIGEVVKGRGLVSVESKFSQQVIEF